MDGLYIGFREAQMLKYIIMFTSCVFVNKVLMWSTEMSTGIYLLATSLIIEFERLDRSVSVFTPVKVIIF